MIDVVGGQNRRRFARYRVDWEIEIYLSSDFSLRVLPEDAGEGGLCVRLPLALTEEHVTLVFDPQMKISAQRKWVSDPDANGEVRLGFQYRGLTAWELECIKNLLPEHG